MGQSLSSYRIIDYVVRWLFKINYAKFRVSYFKTFLKISFVIFDGPLSRIGKPQLLEKTVKKNMYFILIIFFI